MKNVFESNSGAEKAMKMFEDFEKEIQKPWKTDFLTKKISDFDTKELA